MKGRVLKSFGSGQKQVMALASTKTTSLCESLFKF